MMRERPPARLRRLLYVTASAALLAWPGIVHAAPGDLDTSFGGTGVVYETFGTSASLGGVALQADGKVVAAGTAGATPPGSVALARYAANGILDSSFGSGGLVATALSASASAVVLQSDGKIVTLGNSGGNAGGQFVVARFDSGGALDSMFGTGGSVTTDCGSAAYAHALVLQPDGALVAGGVRGDGMICLVRYRSNGSLDSSFGTGGIVTGPNGAALGLALQSDGKLLAAGNAGNDLTVTRFTANGSVDGGFGSGGLAHANFTPLSSGVAQAVVVQPNGRIVAAGGAGGTDLAVVRFLANGVLDSSFGTGGVARLNLGDTDVANALVLQPDGDVLVAGSRSTPMPPLGSTSGFLVARYGVDGTLDTTFGTNGVASANPGNGGGVAVVLQPDGKAIVGGSVSTNPMPPQGEFAVARYFALVLSCPASAATGCKAPTVAGGAKLKIKETVPAAKSQLNWQWKKGSATSLADLGDPTTTDTYAICLYDESSGSSLIGGAVVPPGGICGSKPCWKPLGATGFAYADHDRTRFGIGTIKLHTGMSGAAKITLKGQGTTLPRPALPLGLPSRVQLIRVNGPCWDATFSRAGLKTNTAGAFQGKSD
jgi:uncharacterized delta-60 repeat protein